jgi:RNA polymerase sigma factor (sigma-70 family)
LKQSIWKVLEEQGHAVHSLLLRLTLRRDVAEELFQEVCVRMGAKLGVENPGAYVRRVAINLAMDWRRRRRDLVEVGEVNAKGRAVAEVAEDAEDVERILDAAEALTALSREAFVLRFVQGESYERVGDVIGKSAHQARGLCHAAVKEIRKRLNVRQVVHERDE